MADDGYSERDPVRTWEGEPAEMRTWRLAPWGDTLTATPLATGVFYWGNGNLVDITPSALDSVGLHKEEKSE